MREHLVEPLQGPGEVHFNPAWRRGHILTVVLGTPALDKAHADYAHFGQLINGFKAIVNGHGQQFGKLSVVEDLQAAARRYLANGGWMELVRVVAVPALYKDGTVTEAFSIDFTSDIVQVNAFPNVPPCVFNRRVAVDIRQEAKAKAIVVV